MTSQDDGTAQHHLNQYIIKQEIGRGSFGAVHLAVDQYGKEYVRTLAKRQYAYLTQVPGCQRVLKITTTETGTVRPPSQASESKTTSSDF